MPNGDRPPINRGGRPRAFAEPTERLNVLLPAGMVRAIRQQALETLQTPGLVLAAYLAVTFRREGVMPYADEASPQADSRPQAIPGYLIPNTASGHPHFIATDDQGHRLDLNQLSPMIHPWGSTTPEALADLVGKWPDK